MFVRNMHVRYERVYIYKLKKQNNKKQQLFSDTDKLLTLLSQKTPIWTSGAHRSFQTNAQLGSYLPQVCSQGLQDDMASFSVISLQDILHSARLKLAALCNARSSSSKLLYTTDQEAFYLFPRTSDLLSPLKGFQIVKDPLQQTSVEKLTNIKKQIISTFCFMIIHKFLQFGLIFVVTITITGDSCSGRVLYLKELSCKPSESMDPISSSSNSSQPDSH